MIPFSQPQIVPAPDGVNWSTSTFPLPARAVAVLLAVDWASTGSNQYLNTRADSADVNATSHNQLCQNGGYQQTALMITSLSAGKTFDYYADFATSVWKILGYWTDDEVTAYNPHVYLGNAASFNLSYVAPGATGFGIICYSSQLQHPDDTYTLITPSKNHGGAKFVACDNEQQFVNNGPTTGHVRIVFSWNAGCLFPLVPSIALPIDAGYDSIVNTRPPYEGVLGFAQVDNNGGSFVEWAAGTSANYLYSADKAQTIWSVAFGTPNDRYLLNYDGTNRTNAFVVAGYTLPNPFLRGSDWIAVGAGFQKTVQADFTSQARYSVNSRGIINGIIVAATQLRVNTFAMSSTLQLQVGGIALPVPASREVTIDLPKGGIDISAIASGGLAYLILATDGVSLYSRE